MRRCCPACSRCTAPHCHSDDTRARRKTTHLGYARYFCRTCQHTFNERTGTPFNHIEVPTDIVFQVLYCRLRFKLSYRHVAELFWLSGFHFSHETVREWSEHLASEFAEYIHSKRQQTFGRTWYVDETYVRIRGRWCYLYRGIDEYGNLFGCPTEGSPRYGGGESVFQAGCRIDARAAGACGDRRPQ
ncbi:MAG: DDE-type integrase/transposase/recombinase [Cyanobacteria bacterium P01_H01_bin.153]